MPRHAQTALAARHARGFTLVELMVTIFVFAILVAIAVPSFERVIGSTKLTGLNNDLLADLKYARTQAVSRGSGVAVNASSGGWEDGWSVVASPATAGGTAEVLRVHDVIPTTYTLEAGTATGETGESIGFNAQGALTTPSKGVCFTIKAPDGSHHDPLRLVVRPIGTVSQFKGSASSDTHCGS